MSSLSLSKSQRELENGLPLISPQSPTLYTLIRKYFSILGRSEEGRKKVGENDIFVIREVLRQSWERVAKEIDNEVPILFVEYNDLCSSGESYPYLLIAPSLWLPRK